nr:HD domain-containing phosphohydrolase [Ardenticatena sp.]
MHHQEDRSSKNESTASHEAFDEQIPPDLFRHVPFLAPLNEEQRRALAAQSLLRHYAPGEMIIREGALGHSFFIIESGNVIVTKQIEGGEVEMGSYGPGAFFGEMALIQDAPRSASIRAETVVRAIEISREGFESVVMQNPAVILAVMRELSQRLRHTDQNMIEYLVHKNEALRQAQEEIKRSYDATLIALSSALDLRDTATEGHSIRVAKIALEIGKEVGLSDEDLEILWRGALLHDIGKIGVPDRILHKSGALTEREWKIMRQHTIWGAAILQHVPFLAPSIPVVKYHHENWDGSGYPEGLKGEEIPLIARIFMVADTYDAITSDRPYQRGRPPEEALRIIREQSGKRFDPAIVEAFERAFERVKAIH